MAVKRVAKKKKPATSAKPASVRRKVRTKNTGAEKAPSLGKTLIDAVADLGTLVGKGAKLLTGPSASAGHKPAKAPRKPPAARKAKAPHDSRGR